MRVHLDDQEIRVPDAATLGELLGGVRPLIDPGRFVTLVEVDGVPADATDAPALDAWRLRADAAVRIGTETPDGFVQSRRAEMHGHLQRIADLLAAASEELTSGAVTQANRRLAAATRDLRLVLELDQHLALLERGDAACRGVAAVVERIGPELTAAERDRRWPEVAALLTRELVPVLRATRV